MPLEKKWELLFYHRISKKITGISRFESVENVGENIKSHGFSNTIKDFFTLVSNLCKKIKYLLPHCQIRSLNLTVISANEDPQEAAMGFGVVCSAVYPAAGLLYSLTKPSKQPPDMNISCDFTTTEPVFDFKCTLSCSAFFILVAVLRLAFEDWRKRKKKIINSKNLLSFSDIRQIPVFLL